ncbi:nucleoside hydrolase [Irpex rosettiformis]|uniref:Nucleoside hydrolase n=1 Tax=Irpex rosettiformis TaxID=378272 RepID=A0ACB8UFN8_9APHY|nr:nucleoside hydrolase [Irpex rosettiformis]
MASTTDSKNRIPVIIDTDPGVDDILAILLALASPEIDVKAIIITFGNTDLEAAHLNILRLSQVLSRHFQVDSDSSTRFFNFTRDKKIILAKGADRPLEGDLHSAQYFHGRDGLGGISERYKEFDVFPNNPELYPNLIFSEKSGVEVAHDVLSSEPERTVTYIVLGPLTTLAQVARAHGDLLRNRIGRVACMGGALDVPGNTSPVAEFNFFADPYAVHEILTPANPAAAAIPLDRFMLISLDITTPHELPFPFYAKHIDTHFTDTKNPSITSLKTPLVHFTSAFLERTREVMLSFGKDAMELHDIVAVWFATQNPPSASQEGDVAHSLREGWAAVPRHFQVERVGEITRGMLVVDRRDDEGAYDPGANRAAVQAELTKHSFHSSGIMESNAVPAQVEVEVPPSMQNSPNTGAPQKGDTAQLKQTPGIPVLVKTPGPEALLKLMTERVWGVSIP